MNLWRQPTVPGDSRWVSLETIIHRHAVRRMSITTDVAMLRVLALIANADGSVAPEEQQMLQRICGEDLQLERSDAWRDALTSAMDLKTAATSIPLEKRSLVLKLAYLVISACGTERGFPINPAELYAFNALVNHLSPAKIKGSQLLQPPHEQGLARPMGQAAILSASTLGTTATRPNACPNPCRGAKNS